MSSAIHEDVLFVCANIIRMKEFVNNGKTTHGWSGCKDFLCEINAFLKMLYNIFFSESLIIDTIKQKFVHIRSSNFEIFKTLFDGQQT